jgi:hypothetical protein
LIANENTRYIIIALECHLVYNMLFTDVGLSTRKQKRLMITFNSLHKMFVVSDKHSIQS